MDSTHNLSNPSFHSFPAYHPSAAVSTTQSCHEVELLTSNLQNLTFQEANSTNPLPHPTLSELRVASPPEVKLELGVSPEGLAEGDGRRLPLPPQLEETVLHYLSQIHGGGLEYFDAPMLKDYLEKLIQESLRLVSQGKLPPHSPHQAGPTEEA